MCLLVGEGKEDLTQTKPVLTTVLCPAVDNQISELK